MQDFTDLLKQHRSIRSYLPTPIDPQLIETACADAIAGGSSSGNLNSVSIVLTRDPARKARLAELHFDQPMVNQAPLVMTFCADWYRTRRWLKLRGARDNFDNFLGYLVAAFDAMIVAQNVALALEEQGLGICYMGTTLHSCAEIGQVLGLPETCMPVTSMVVGYPAEDPPKRDRLPIKAFLHDERYQMPSDEDIEEIFREREVRGWARYMASPELRPAIEKSGIKSLAEFYTSDHKYPPDVFRRDSAKLLQLLQDKGFWM